MTSKELLWYMMKFAIHKHLGEDYFVIEVVNGKLDTTITEHNKDMIAKAKSTPFYSNVTTTINKVLKREDYNQLTGYIVVNPTTKKISEYLTTDIAFKQAIKEVEDKVHHYLVNMDKDKRFILTNATKLSLFTLNVTMKQAFNLSFGVCNLKDISRWGEIFYSETHSLYEVTTWQDAYVHLSSRCRLNIEKNNQYSSMLEFLSFIIALRYSDTGILV